MKNNERSEYIFLNRAHNFMKNIYFKKKMSKNLSIGKRKRVVINYVLGAQNYYSLTFI